LALLPGVKNPGQAERLAVILDAYRDAWRAARSYRALARTLNAAGVKAPAGGRWTAKAATRVAEALGLYAPTPRGPRDPRAQSTTPETQMTAAA
jgi:hypothetical protein